MDAIFALGTRVAESSCGDPAHAANARRWRAQIGELQRDLASWARWDEHLPRLENSAALALQSFARRRSEYRRFQVAVREARMRRHMAEQMAERAATSIQNSTRKVQAMQLVAQRRGAIRIQRHWRGYLGRRKAASLAAAPAAAAPAAAAAAAAALVEAGKANAGGMGSTAGSTATAPSPRQSLSFGGRLAKSLSFGRRSKADGTLQASPVDTGTAEGAAAAGVLAAATPRRRMMWTPRGLSTPRTLASAPTTSTPRSHFLRRSLSFESGAVSGARRRAAERDEDLVGLPPLPPTFDQDWHEQLQGRLAVLDTALVPEKPHPIRRAFSFTRLSARSASRAATKGQATRRSHMPEAGAPSSGAVDFSGYRNEILFDDDGGDDDLALSRETSRRRPGSL